MFHLRLGFLSLRFLLHALQLQIGETVGNRDAKYGFGHSIGSAVDFLHGTRSPAKMKRSMYLFHVLRSFQPLHNPIGFGASDFVEFCFAVLLVVLVFARAWLEPAALKLARHTGWCMLFLGSLAIILRLALLPVHPVPTPSGADDFSYLLSADTLAHFRLANPTHPLHRFFETTFVVQNPTYSSIYPIGPAIFLALGQLIFGLPWAGVLLSLALFCALSFWMLRGWTTPGWALVGGLLTICQFGPLNTWANGYWGGAVSALDGCLVFGALPRLREHVRTRDAVLLGLGIGAQMLTRPFESLFLDLSVLLFCLPELLDRKAWPKLAKLALPAALAILPAVVLLLFHDKAVTGRWTQIPYVLSRYQYGVPTTLTFQPNPVPHAQLTAAQQLLLRRPGRSAWTHRHCCHLFRTSREPRRLLPLLFSVSAPAQPPILRALLTPIPLRLDRAHSSDFCSRF